MAQFLSHLSAGSEVYRGHLLYDLSGGEKSSATGRKLFTHAGAQVEEMGAEAGWKSNGKEELSRLFGTVPLAEALLIKREPAQRRLACVLLLVVGCETDRI